VKQIRQRLTYANVMSSLAVFFILGGATALAANKITAKQLQSNSVTTAKIKKNAITASKIKNNAISTSKIAKDAVTGDKVNEATLGTVPSATNATNAINATNAGNANTVNGQKIFKVNYRANEGSGPTTMFSALGLTITGQCAAGEIISVTATTSKQNSSIYTFVGSDLEPEEPAEDDLEGGGFDPGDNFDLLAGGNGNINFVHFEFDALDGTIATGTLAVDESGEVNDCLATGDVIIG
jgi:hypothetical protein